MKQYLAMYVDKRFKSLEILELEETFILEVNKKLNENLDSDELFLARGFKSIINNASTKT